MYSRNEQLTYRELNAKANQLARYLQGLGVGPEVLVGLCIERSWEMVVAMLGILKAGGAYVPLGPGLSSRPFGFHARRCQLVNRTHSKTSSRRATKCGLKR